MLTLIVASLALHQAQRLCALCRSGQWRVRESHGGKAAPQSVRRAGVGHKTPQKQVVQHQICHTPPVGDQLAKNTQDRIHCPIFQRTFMNWSKDFVVSELPLKRV